MFLKIHFSAELLMHSYMMQIHLCIHITILFVLECQSSRSELVIQQALSFTHFSGYQSLLHSLTFHKC